MKVYSDLFGGEDVEKQSKGIKRGRRRVKHF